MKNRIVIFDKDDLDGRIIEGVFKVNDEVGQVIECPMPDAEVIDCSLLYCGCCAAMSETGILNLPPLTGESWGRAVGYVCRGKEIDPRFHVNPTTFDSLSVES